MFYGPQTSHGGGVHSRCASYFYLPICVKFTASMINLCCFEDVSHFVVA